MHAVTTCPNGVTALEMLRDKNQHFDLVLSDVYMPGEWQYTKLGDRMTFQGTQSSGMTLLSDLADVDGFKLLELIGLELDVPVISKQLQSPVHYPLIKALSIHRVTSVAVMSSNGETSVVLRGVTHGAVDFLIKPVRIRELRNVWQHVVRRKRDQVCPVPVPSLVIQLHFSGNLADPGMHYLH